MAGLSLVLIPEGRMLFGGEAQMLALARDLMSEPKILLIDEPSAADVDLEHLHDMYFARTP